MVSDDSTPSAFESPIEERFAFFADIFLRGLHFWKHGCAIGRPSIFKQYEIRVSGATFRIDFVAQSIEGERIAFECDGRDFHRDRQRDLLRDAMILNSKEISAIYRFAGEDINSFWCTDILRFVLRQHGSYFPDHTLGPEENRLGLAIWKESNETATGIKENAEYAIEGDFEQTFEDYIEEVLEEEVDDETGFVRLERQMKCSRRNCVIFVPSRTKRIRRELRFLAPHATELAALLHFADRHSDLNFSDLRLALKAECGK